MAENFKLTASAADAAADAVTALLNGGALRIYSGRQPVTADGPTRGDLLAELRFGTPAFAPASGGSRVANPLTAEPRARATGRASWFRTFRADETPVFDGSAGEAGCDINLQDADIRIDAIVSVERLTYTQPKA